LALPQKLLALPSELFLGRRFIRGAPWAARVDKFQTCDGLNSPRAHEPKHFAADFRSTQVGPRVSPPAVTRQKIWLLVGLDV
jgi:hypothetical protein